VRRLGLITVAFAALAHTAPAQAGCNGNNAWQDRFPAWSEGSAIAFLRQQPGCDPPPESLGIVQPGSTEEVTSGGGRRGSSAPPSWDPNGVAIAFGSEAGTVRVDGPGGPVGDDGPGLFPSWSGSTIAVTVGSSLQLIELVTGGRRTLVPSYAKPTQSNGAAVWSPDGRQLAFGLMLNEAEGGIGIVNADGSNFRVIARAANQSVNPAWSPDGRTIAFETNRGGDFEIYSVGADGTDLRNLTDSPGEDRMPAWHGSTIAFISNRDRSARDLYGFALYTMTSEGRGQLWRAGDLHPYSGLAWSPDGSRIAFSSGRECLRWGIYVLQLGDDSVQRLTNRCSFDGTLGNDTVRGSPFRDFINGHGGRDHLYGLGGPDLLRGELGGDNLDGGPGDDTLIGGRGDDVAVGGGGNDRVLTEDRGRDRVFGGKGDDLIESGSGSRDVIFCGPGSDTVFADRRDRVAPDCERVRRG
jgi:Tol biopolymer transport system component